MGSNPTPAADEEATLSSSWHALQVRHLAALKAVAEEGSFHRGARKLGYSQSAVSQQIAALERVVGEQLLTRSPSVAPTPAGEIVLREADAILSRLRAADVRLQALRSGRAGLVRVGVYWGVAGLFLSQVLEEVPEADLRFTEALADSELFRSLDDGELDLAFVALPTETGPYAAQPLLMDEFLLLHHDEHPLAGVDRLSLDDLQRVRLLCLRRCRSTTALLGRLAERGIEPEIAFRSDDTGTLMGLAGPTDAVFLPALHVGEQAGPLRVRRFVEQPFRRLGLAWHEARPPTGTAVAFVDACRTLLTGSEKRLAPRRPDAPAELRVSLETAR